ncbi:MAG: NADP-dependent isocitrate dehydrogenase [Fimbriimonadaceae bacterium]|nr:NADP-dependent isocitrate dehydrogenase [Fimbriimonadaceae bacterium]
MKSAILPEYIQHSDTMKTVAPITVAYGDGIGPEIMRSALRILEAGGAKLAVEDIEIGEEVYNEGHSAGIKPEAWDSLRRTKVFFKAPITTPQGSGFKSLNVTIRKSLGLFANVRPCVTYHPFVKSTHQMDVVVIRENEEDLYAGIEHRQTDEVYQCLKIISRPGCERIVRYAFEYARAYGRKKVTCMTKDNIMKLTDGLFHKVFDEIALEYPEIETEHWIIDIGMARAANRPEMFDVIVTPNLYGDILSDVTAEVAGSVGLAPSANIGTHCAMFEAIHGSAPRLERDIANPSGLLLAGVMMLVHLGQTEAAERVHNAWLKTMEDGIHTADIFDAGKSTRRVGTAEFTEEVIARLGQKPTQLTPVFYDGSVDMSRALQPVMRSEPATKELVGVDVFVQWNGTADELASKLEAAVSGSTKLQMITNRGVKVWPNGLPETFCTDHWRCRFMGGDARVSHHEVINLLGQLADAEIDFIKMEHLCTFDGVAGYSLGQGQ